MDKRGWIIFAVAVIALLAGLIAFSRQSNVDVSSYDHAKILTATDKPKGAIPDHVYGLPADKAQVVLIEYGDFQCPGCGQLHKTTEPLLKEYQDKIAFVFRNFPLPQLHPNARAAASAAEAAGLQGKYWQMNNQLYDHQADWENLSIEQRDDMFASYAKQLGLDVDQFKTDYASDKVSQKINFDQSLGKQNGVNATPTLYLNGKKLDTSEFGTYDELEATLDKAVKASQSDKKAS